MPDNKFDDFLKNYLFGDAENSKSDLQEMRLKSSILFAGIYEVLVNSGIGQGTAIAMSCDIFQSIINASINNTRN